MESIVRQTLARHREDPPLGIELMLPVHHHMDQDFCAAVSKDLREYCAAWEKRLAIPDLWKQLPAESGVYVFVFASPLYLQTTSEMFSPAWVLYVGRAGDANSRRTIRDRYKGEYGKYIGKDPDILWTSVPCSSREDRLSLYLTIYPLFYWYATVEDRERIPFIEDRLIKLLAPMINGRQLPRVDPKPHNLLSGELPDDEQDIHSGV